MESEFELDDDQDISSVGAGGLLLLPPPPYHTRGDQWRQDLSYLYDGDRDTVSISWQLGEGHKQVNEVGIGCYFWGGAIPPSYLTDQPHNETATHPHLVHTHAVMHMCSRLPSTTTTSIRITKMVLAAAAH
jgi:hypothetical protein